MERLQQRVCNMPICDREKLNFKQRTVNMWRDVKQSVTDKAVKQWSVAAKVVGLCPYY